MGHKISPWAAEWLFRDDGIKRVSDDTYTLIDNPYGYQVNINSDRPIMRSGESINDLYRRYKTKQGIPAWCPLSDAERREFERYVMPIIERIRRHKDD